MLKNNNNIDVHNFIKVAKRISITVIACLPFLLVFSYLMRKKITASWAYILIYLAVFLIVVGIEELIVRHREKQKAERERLGKSRDVFK